VILEGLHAERQPVHPGRAQACRSFGCQLAGVGLDRDLQGPVASKSRRVVSISRPMAAGRHRPGVPPPK